MTNHPPFNEMSLAAGGHIRTALLDEHRVLTCMVGWNHIFVITHADDTAKARETATRICTEQEGFRDVYLIAVTDEQMTAIATPGVVLNVAVLITADNFQPAATAIRLYDTAQITLPTEHGDFLTELTTSRELKTGDVYVAGMVRLGGEPTGYVVYRARADYNPLNGWTEHHIVEPGFTPKPGDRTGALTDGPDEIVFRLVDKTGFLNQLGLTDLAVTAASRS